MILNLGISGDVGLYLYDGRIFVLSIDLLGCYCLPRFDDLREKALGQGRQILSNIVLTALNELCCVDSPDTSRVLLV